MHPCVPKPINNLLTVLNQIEHAVDRQRVNVNLVRALSAQRHRAMPGIGSIRFSSIPISLLTLLIAGSMLFGTSRAMAQSTYQTANSSNTQSQPIPAKPSPKDLGLQIVARALYESVWGKPITSEVSQTTELYDRHISGFGKYIRGGQGSGRLRMSLQQAAGNQMNSLLQTSDGELLYTHLVMGESETRTRVDLGKIRERLVITRESLTDPIISMHLAVGGQAEVLRAAIQTYEWTQVDEQIIAGSSVWVLLGSVTPQPTGPAGQTEMDRRFSASVQSRLFPNRCKLIVGRSGSPFEFWLYRIEQWQDESIATQLPNAGGVRSMTEWPKPREMGEAELAQELFEIPSTSDHFIDEWKLYLPPVNQTAQNPGAQQIARYRQANPSRYLGLMPQGRQTFRVASAPIRLNRESTALRSARSELDFSIHSGPRVHEKIGKFDPDCRYRMMGVEIPIEQTCQVASRLPIDRVKAPN